MEESNNNSNELIMSFDPHTIEHLGIRMYSTLPPVLSELIANAHDADAHNVKIILMDILSKKKIIFEDDGYGMSFEELNKKFLRIGRNRRKDENKQKTPEGRLIIGKKGLGKLAFFGIAQEIEIETIKKGVKNSFVMKWEDIEKGDNEYKPEIICKDEKVPEEKDGTKIILKNLKRESDFSYDYCSNLADSISKIFIIDQDFKISIRHNYEPDIPIENERKYEKLDKQIEWQFPKDILFESDYGKKGKISGIFIATKSPIPARTNMRGITLFSRKKLVNAPEYFSNSISSHFFSYITGWLEADFIDELEEDVISTNRQSLNWNHPEMEKLREYLKKVLNWLERDWREKRAKIREEEITKKTGVNIKNWFSKVPKEIVSHIEPIVKAIIRDSELPEETMNKVVSKDLHFIAPEYIYWHYRNLHPEIQVASKEKYNEGDYYRAFQEAVKRYVNNIRTKVDDNNLNPTDFNMFQHVFGNGERCKLKFKWDKYSRPDGSEFNPATKQSIRNVQEFLSKGVSCGENPLSHEEISHIIDSELFHEKDCLDMLSILSHLTKRLDKDFELNS